MAFMVLLFSCFVNNLKAQMQENKTGPLPTANQREAKEGTYQFIYHPSKLQYLFTTETLIEIERKRDNKVVIYIWVAPTVEVKILPKEYVESSDFTPLSGKKYVD